MKPVRTAARALLASIFVVQGVRSFTKPDDSVEAAGLVTERVKPLLEKVDPRIPTDTRTLVRIKGASDVIAGLALATGHLTRPAAAVLAAGLVPATIAHAREDQSHFLKNLGLLGGLLLAAVDTEGRPGLGYRAGHAVDRSQLALKHAADRSERSIKRSQRSVKRAVRTARREAKIAAMSAATARKLPG
ncbi:DoxX family membrane protein [Paractinoplanes lichenicola]|uniref:DoxX family membrane protein n=1 Tax=Paractinoplanes lichenicola TaxID=2802976 RepID=A0ABS1W400_9ACTN|nr:DoxX family membrane protein [Actinoplanes lichenicola]MBL7261442.1 DoxX family membrane protein [Actinoplanes lichenicola]